MKSENLLSISPLDTDNKSVSDLRAITSEFGQLKQSHY